MARAASPAVFDACSCRSPWVCGCGRMGFGGRCGPDWLSRQAFSRVLGRRRSRDDHDDLLDAARAVGERRRALGDLCPPSRSVARTRDACAGRAWRPTGGTTGASSRCRRPGRAAACCHGPSSMLTSTLPTPRCWAQATPPMAVVPALIVDSGAGGVDPALEILIGASVGPLALRSSTPCRAAYVVSGQLGRATCVAPTKP